MKRIFNLLFVLLLTFCLLTFTIEVNAATTVYNIVTCPGEDMATQMQINWQSPTTIKNLKLEYTKANDTKFSDSIVVDAEYKSFSRQNDEPFSGTIYVGFSTPRYVWNVNLNDLTPKTKYIYRIIKDNEVLSEIYNFETASKEDDEFSFLFITDPQYYDEEGAQIFNTIAERHIKNDDVKFAFITGDISDKGGNSSYWDMFYTKSSIKKIPFAATVGNHDYYDSKTTRTDNYIFNNFFYNPQNGPEHVKGSSYYFVYNQALFIMLDSEEKYNTEEQKQWVRDVCKSVDCSYIIVGCHKSAYPAGPYVSLGKTFIAEWGPVFDECQVDLVLSGHDHVFTRTKNLVNGEPTDEKYKGTVYIEGGAAGPKYYAIQSTENEYRWAAVVEKRICGTVITLGKETYTTATYSKSGSLLDSSTNYRKRFGEIDETYTKEEFEQSLEIEVNEQDISSGKLTWDKKGYGHVRALTITHKNSGDNLGTITFVNELTTSFNLTNKIWMGEINEYDVEVAYRDNTIKTVNVKVDNTIDWGYIDSCQAIDITSKSFNLLINLKLNQEYQYITRIRVTEYDVVKKNFFIKSEHYLTEQLIIELSNKLMEPNTTHTYTIDALNVNGNVAWSYQLTVTSLRELTEDEIYQNEMANIAFKMMIDNLLAALNNK